MPNEAHMLGPSGATGSGRRLVHSGPATVETARYAIQSVTGWLTNAGLADEALSDVEIALAEAVNNVVKHGYRGVIEGCLRLDCFLTDQELRIDLSDSGPGMPGGVPPRDRTVDLNVGRDELPEGGFGWLLIRQIVTELEYARRGERNVLTLRFDICRNRAGPC